MARALAEGVGDHGKFCDGARCIVCVVHQMESPEAMALRGTGGTYSQTNGQVQESEG